MSTPNGRLHERRPILGAQRDGGGQNELSSAIDDNESCASIDSFTHSSVSDRPQTADFAKTARVHACSFWFACLFSGCSFVVFVSCVLALTAKTPEVFVANPLHWRLIATLMVWLFVIILCLAVPGVVFAVREGARDKTDIGFRAISTLIGGALSIAAMVLLLATPAGTCVGGWPHLLEVPSADCFCDRVMMRDSSSSRPEKVPPDLTIAFVGDSAVAQGEEVLRLIRDEGVSAVVFNGDTSYIEDNEHWVHGFREHLGATPFYIAAHDPSKEFQRRTASQLSSLQVNGCRGEVGVANACHHRGIDLVLKSLAGSCGGNDLLFESALSEFAQQDVAWPVCVFSFHDNRNALEEDPWENYDLCLQRGALIISSHGESIARTHELDGFDGAAPHAHVSREVQPGSDSSEAAVLRDGHSVVVMTGSSKKEAQRAQPSTANASSSAKGSWGTAMVDMLSPEEAAEEASKQSESAGGVSSEKEVLNTGPAQDEITIYQGAFFCRFHVDGDPNLARCFFKDIAGRLADDFYIHRPSKNAGETMEFV